ncbi:MAG: Bax inhibitor-1/YccA family protein, partial [Propionibacteriaceae bacterium]|nr:Bax inhibitor-1/YccA family protein [Propionibacteriaceae bacterium]
MEHHLIKEFAVTNPVLAKSPAFSAQYAPMQSAPTYQPYDPATGQQQTWGQPGFVPGQYATGQSGDANSAPGGANPQFAQAPQYPPTQGYPPQTWQTPPVAPVQKTMTLDDVLTKTGVTLGTTIVVALIAMWSVLHFGAQVSTVATAGVICGLATIIFPFVAASRRTVGPVLAIGFAVLEGVFLGAISLIFELAYPGIVLQAVSATFVAAAITLAAFHFGNFRLSGKMRKVVMISIIAYAGVALVNLVLSFAGINLGLFPGPGQAVSGWAWLAAGVGVVLAVLSLVDDFQFVEQGIANRAPASESWRAAYGLTVTLV